MRRALFLLLLSSATAQANPLDTFGFGSRETALGGAAAADVKGVAAAYYNPAGLVRSKGLEVMIGYFRADHFLEMNGKDNQVDPVKGLTGGVVAPGKVFGLPVAFGIALHLPDDRVSRIRALRQEQPRWELYDNRNQRLYFAANLAIEPFDWLQIGGGLSFMAATRGRLDITGSANIFKPEQSQLRHEVDADLTAVRYPQIGARIAAGKRAAFALVYRGEFQLKLDIDANLNGDISSLTTALYQLRTSTVNAFLPQQLVLGGSFLATDDVRLNLDLTWMNWSAYIPPVADIDVVLDIPPPAGGWPPSIQPPTTPAPITMVPIRMKDTFVPHVGVEWRAVARPKWEILARGGYEWAQSPIPDQTGTTNYVDRDRHSFSIGAGLRLIAPGEVLPGDVRLDLHLQMHELVTRTTQKDDPADTVGDYTAGGRIWAFGSSLAVGF